MWTRVEIKAKAKEVLRKTYWMALVISFILYIAGAGYSFSGNNNRRSNLNTDSQIRYSIGIIEVTDYNISINIPGNNNTKITTINPINPIYSMGFIPDWTVFLISIIGVLSILFLLLRIIAGYHVQVGGYKYFIDTAKSRESNFSNLSIGFRNGNYWNIFKTMFLRDLYTFLWTLLFVIPGIIKGYSYAFVPYILADNPKIESSKAIQISMDMTQGHKLNMFVLNLSFLGWYILGSIALGIGIIFVRPYENATYAQLYLILRQDAITRGIINENELSV